MFPFFVVILGLGILHLTRNICFISSAISLDKYNGHKYENILYHQLGIVLGLAVKIRIPFSNEAPSRFQSVSLEWETSRRWRQDPFSQAARCSLRKTDFIQKLPKWTVMWALVPLGPISLALLAILCVFFDWSAPVSGYSYCYYCSWKWLCIHWDSTTCQTQH